MRADELAQAVFQDQEGPGQPQVQVQKTMIEGAQFQSDFDAGAFCCAPAKGSHAFHKMSVGY